LRQALGGSSSRLGQAKSTTLPFPPPRKSCSRHHEEHSMLYLLFLGLGSAPTRGQTAWKRDEMAAARTHARTHYVVAGRRDPPVSPNGADTEYMYAVLRTIYGSTTRARVCCTPVYVTAWRSVAATSPVCPLFPSPLSSKPAAHFHSLGSTLAHQVRGIQPAQVLSVRVA
jgi:hypothetical protein